MAGPAGQRSTSLVKTKRLYVLTDSVTYDIFKIGLYKNLGFIKRVSLPLGSKIHYSQHRVFYTYSYYY